MQLAKSLAENFISEHHLKYSEINSLTRWIDKLLNKIGDVATKEVVLEISTACQRGDIKNPAATLIAEIKNQLEDRPDEKPQQDSTYIQEKRCPGCRRLGYTLETCTFCNPRSDDWPQPDDTRNQHKNF